MYGFLYLYYNVQKTVRQVSVLSYAYIIIDILLMHANVLESKLTSLAAALAWLNSGEDYLVVSNLEGILCASHKY